ncbi:MAG: MltA domain-containing protein, partial [Campylobacterota bacterium]|nr:MltA domain-containing protein [Campylobacterota bacterium]
MFNILTKKYIPLGILSALFIVGCGPKVEIKENISKANLQKVKWKDMKGFEYDNLDLSLKVFQKDCRGSKRYNNLKEICEKSKLFTDGKEFFKSNFTPYKLLSDEKDDNGLITGYYSPLLYGSLTQTYKYKYPIYATPEDLLTIDLSSVYPELKKYRLRGKIEGNKVIPYPNREEIETSNNLEPICFVDDKVDLFFLQIQGSGKVQLENGDILNIGYAQQNGRKYYSIGRKLIELNEVSREDMSLQAIKKWLLENRLRIDEILNLNDSYVFF